MTVAVDPEAVALAVHSLTVKLRPRKGDVLVFEDTPGRAMQREAIQALEAGFRAQGMELTLLLIPHGAKVANLSPADMAKVGWVRSVKTIAKRAGAPVRRKKGALDPPEPKDDHSPLPGYPLDTPR